MIEFKVIENLKPNKDLTDILKDFKYKVKLGQIKTIIHTNLKVITPTEYQITYPTTSYNKVVVFNVPLQGQICYTVNGAVDWYNSPTA